MSLLGLKPEFSRTCGHLQQLPYWDIFIILEKLVIGRLEDENIAMIGLSVLYCAMSYYSAQFWLSAYLQQIVGLSAFDVAVRLLPQALIGLSFSPLVGLIMHKISATALLVVAGTCSVVSSLVLVFVHVGPNYLPWILPSLMLSQIGMDWTFNIGSLYILSVLPLNHQSIGASTLQAIARLGVPLGLSVTTAIWSAYDGKGGLALPELPYIKAFVITAAFAAFSLILAPFIIIGRQGQKIAVQPATKVVAEMRRTSKRWSLDEESCWKSSVSSITHLPPARSPSLPRKNNTERETWWKTHPDPQTRPGHNPNKIKRVVCERCLSREPAIIKSSILGDPAKYFNDAGCVMPSKHNHDMIVSGSRRKAMILDQFMKA